MSYDDLSVSRRLSRGDEGAAAAFFFLFVDHFVHALVGPCVDGDHVPDIPGVAFCPETCRDALELTLVFFRDPVPEVLLRDNAGEIVIVVTLRPQVAFDQIIRRLGRVVSPLEAYLVGHSFEVDQRPPVLLDDMGVLQQVLLGRGKCRG